MKNLRFSKCQRSYNPCSEFDLICDFHPFLSRGSFWENLKVSEESGQPETRMEGILDSPFLLYWQVIKYLEGQKLHRVPHK